ncbi:MAG: poly-gamma-glutamate biosynthesis protein PgsC/CapC [Pseudomonadota bacterium]|nr:poly-gamma-glutamate biosynthesis protein PgsC/CapC [Pseudomonadota bacterium]
MLTIFPAQALDSSVITTVWVGLCVITLLNLRFGTTLAGLVVPGYLVPLFLIKPASAYVIWAESIVTYLLARLLADQLMRRTGSCTMFGRDRFFALLLVSVFVRVVSDGWLLPMLGRTLADQGWTFDYHNNLYSFGLVIIALTANQMWNGGMARGMGTFVLYVGLTYAIVAGVLIPFTNFDIAGLGFLYEGIASDILASPKAYLILLTTAFIASRMNLHYGWEFSGILIPALLALQWFQPTKLLISILEAVLIFFMGRAALRLPVFRRMNMEGARLLLLFFTLGYVYKLALGFVLTWAFPAVKASDFFAFGYLLSTLLAMKMHQKQISWQITRTTVQTSLMGLVLASIIGYGLAIAWPTDSHIAVESDVQSDHVPTGAALPEQLAIRRRALHASEEGRTPLLFTPAELRDFSDGVRALLRYRTDGRVEQLLAARGALTRGGFLLERAGDWLIVRDANPARGAGLYAVNLRPRTTLAVMVPAPLDESGTFEVGVHLAFADDHSVLASAGTRRQRLPEGRSNVLRNANLPFARFQALTGEAGVLHVRGLATAPGANAPAQLWIQRAVPEGLDVDALAARTGPVDARYDRRRASNPLRDATSAPFAELLLARPARLRLIARTLGGSSIREVVEQQRVDGYLYAWLVARRVAISAAGSGRYAPPDLGDLLYLHSEVIEPLHAVALQWNSQRDSDALRAIHAAATTLGYRLVLHRYVATGAEHAILEEIEGGRRQWGTLVMRLGPTAPYLVEIPRPLAERQTLEYGIRLFARMDARALLVTGAHFAVRADGRGDVLDPANPLTVFNVAHQALVRAMHPAVWTLQVRGRLDSDPRPAPDVVIGFVGKPAAVAESRRLQSLLSTLQGDADTVAMAGTGAAAQQRDAGADVQAAFVRALDGPRFLTLSLSAQARRGYRDRLIDDPDAARFDAVGVPTVRVDVAQRLITERFGDPPASQTRAMVDAYVRSQNIVALAEARRDVASIERVIDPASGRVYLRLGDSAGRAIGWRLLDAEADAHSTMTTAQRSSFASGAGAWLTGPVPQ